VKFVLRKKHASFRSKSFIHLKLLVDINKEEIWTNSEM